MISEYPFTESSRRVFDENLGLHDAFLIVDNYIFVQVCMSICNCIITSLNTLYCGGKPEQH